jgi:hypothetical protein
MEFFYLGCLIGMTAGIIATCLIAVMDKKEG